MLEGPPLAIKQGPMSKWPNLETIPEAASSQEHKINLDEHNSSKEEENASMESVVDMDERQARELWDEVNRNAIEQWFDQEVYPSLLEMNFKCKNYEDQEDTMSHDDVQTPQTETNPSNLGQYINKAPTLNVQSLRQTKQMANIPFELHPLWQRVPAVRKWRQIMSRSLLDAGH